MSASAKVRLVHCPKCRVVLKEPAHIPVYKCGGCGTALQAKHRSFASVNSETANGKPESPKTCPESEHNSEENGSTSSSRCAFLSSEEKVECKNGDQYRSKEKGSLATVSSLDECKCCGKDESPENGEESDGFFGVRGSNSESSKVALLDFKGTHSTVDVQRQTGQSLQNNRDDSSLIVDNVQTSEEREKPEELDHARSRDKTGTSKGMENYEGTESIPSSIASSEEDMVDMELHRDISKVSTTGSYLTCNSSSSSLGGRDLNSGSPRPGLLDFWGRNSSLEVQQHRDQSLQCNKDSSSLDIDHVQIKAREKPEELDHARSRDKSGVLKVVENQEEGTESIASSIVSSEEDTVHKKLHGDISKVSTTGSYHACNGGSSSLEVDCDDIAPNQQLHLSRRTLFKSQSADPMPQNQAMNMVPSSIRDGGADLPDLQRPKWSTRENFSEYNKTNSGSGLKLKERELSSPLQPNPTCRLAIGVSNILNQGEPKSLIKGMEAQEQGNMQDWEALERVETSRFPSNTARFSRYPSSVYQNEGPSDYMDIVNHGHDEPVQSQKSYPSDKHEYLEDDHLELLRKVDELRDSISRQCIQTRRPNERMPICSHGVQTSETGKRILFQDDCAYRTNDTLRWVSSGNQVTGTRPDKQPLSGFDHEPGQELPRYYTPNYHQGECLEIHHNPPGSMRRKAIVQAYGPSQKPFSGQYKEKDNETVRLCAHNSHHCQFWPCLHCYPENRPIPMQFPSSICLNNGFCRACHGHVCYHPCSPSAGSPLGHIDAKFPLRCHNAHPQDRRFMDPRPERKFFKEKRQPMSAIGTKANARHCRPIAGGAPFLTCYNCWTLLQIPADFLLPGRRCHKLRCGACSKVLAFSLQNGIHIVPFRTQNKNKQDEIYDNADATRDKGTNLHLGTSSSECAQHMKSDSDCPKSDPISYYEDYGLSFCNDYSTESETTFPPPFPNLAQKEIDEKLASSSSQKNAKQVASRMLGSPLHMLFGYSSPSKMIRGSGVSSRRSDTGDLQIVAHNYTTSRGNTARKEITDDGLGSPLHKDSEPGALPDSTEISEEGDVSKNTRKIRDSSVAGFIKKGVRELGQGVKNMKREVFVNGRLLSDRLVKKAEEQAGPIQPAHYR